MWSHYASQHRGVALEFDTAKWIEQMPYMKEQFHKVTYSKTRIRLKLTRAHYDEAQFFNSTILTKDICWKSEEEWRVITKKQGPLEFPVCALTGIIFGCHAPYELIVKVREICQGLPGITLYQAETRRMKFGLDFKPC
jgi:hypothetical protein